MKRISWFLFLVPLFANAGQLDLLHQGIKEVSHLTCGATPPKTIRSKVSDNKLIGASYIIKRWD